MRKILCSILIVVIANLFAQIPSTISFQGRLADATGTAFDDDTYSIHFRLYDSEIGGTEIWDEFQDIETVNGLFSTMLGSVSPFESSVDFTIPLWLSIEVVGHSLELTPRYQLGTSPYAFVAGRAHEAGFSHEADIAYLVSWGDIADMPDGFADGIDDTGEESYTAGDGITITARVISIADDGITSNMINDMGAEIGQVLKYNGIEWTPANDIGGGVGDDWGSQVAETGASLEGNGTVYSPLEITNGGVQNIHIADHTIESSKLNDMGATDGQVLKYNGSNWEPDDDIGGGSGDDWGEQVIASTTPLSGDGTSGSPLVITPSTTEGHVLKTIGGEIVWTTDIGGGVGDDWGSQSAETDATLDGNGTPGSPLGIAPDAVESSHLADNAVESSKLSDMGASSGQVLKYNGSEWVPDDDIGGGSGDDWGDQVIASTTPLSGDGTSGSPLVITPSTTEGHVLKTIGGEIVWTTDIGGGVGDDWGSQVVETDLTLSGDGTGGSPLSVATNAVGWDYLTEEVRDSIQAGGSGGSGDDWGSQAVESDASLEGDGTAGSPLHLASFGAGTDEILKWNGTEWVPSPDEIGAEGTGDITGVVAGNGLTGGSLAGEAVLDVDFDGSGASNTVSRSDHNHDSEYYTQTELATSGSGANVHWDNVTGAPASSSTLWEDTTGFLFPISTSNDTVKISKDSSNVYGVYSSIYTEALEGCAGLFRNTTTNHNTIGIRGEGIYNGSSNDGYNFGGIFWSRSTTQDGYGIYGEATQSAFSGHVFTCGVKGLANSFSEDATTYGVYADAFGGREAIGLYATASSATKIWSGYFANGNIYLKDNMCIGTDTVEAQITLDKYFTYAYEAYSILARSVSTSYTDTLMAIMCGESGTCGLYASSNTMMGYGLKGYGTGNGGCGVFGGSSGSGGKGVIGASYGDASTAVLGTATSVDTNYAICGSAYNGVVNWAGYFDAGNVHIDNTLQIGSGDLESHKLTVVGSGSGLTGSTGYIENSASDGIGLTVRNSSTSSSDVALLVNKERGSGDIVKFDQLNPWDIRFRFTIDGDGRCDGSWTGGGADFAEFFELANHSDQFEPGDVIVLSEKGYYVEATSEKYCGRVLGVYTTNPVVVGGSSAEEDPENAIPVGLLGVCPTKVCSENGAIEVGDYLTTSSTPGVAMKATESCVVIGRAMDNFDSNGTQKINVFVNAGWHDINSRYNELKNENAELRKRIEKLEQLIK